MGLPPSPSAWRVRGSSCLFILHCVDIRQAPQPQCVWLVTSVGDSGAERARLTTSRWTQSPQTAESSGGSLDLSCRQGRAAWQELGWAWPVLWGLGGPAGPVAVCGSPQGPFHLAPRVISSFLLPWPPGFLGTVGCHMTPAQAWPCNLRPPQP